VVVRYVGNPALAGEEVSVAVYKDRSFSVGWMLGGTVLMFASYLAATALADRAAITSPWWLAAIGAASFALPGVVIGWKSDGETLLEAGLAAMISIAFAAGVRGLAELAVDDAPALVVSLGAPVVVAIAAARAGELFHGDRADGDDG
jgi:hypothetical protein